MMDNGQQLINKMLDGDIESIKKGIASGSVLIKIDAIICTVKWKVNDESIINQIQLSKNDNRYLRSVAYTIGEFATAALHLCGVEKYSGDNNSIDRQRISILGVIQIFSKHLTRGAFFMPRPRAKTGGHMPLPPHSVQLWYKWHKTCQS